jgi:hypothetical protein
MIDTDKYEGHTPKHWRRKYNFGQMPFNKADENLIYDAPLLLEEVKRLRKDIVSILGAIDLPDYDEFPNTQEELKQMMLDYGQEHLIAEGY